MLDIVCSLYVLSLNGRPMQPQTEGRAGPRNSDDIAASVRAILSRPAKDLDYIGVKLTLDGIVAPSLPADAARDEVSDWRSPLASHAQGWSDGEKARRVRRLSMKTLVAWYRPFATTIRTARHEHSPASCLRIISSPDGANACRCRSCSSSWRNSSALS